MKKRTNDLMRNVHLRVDESMMEKLKSYSESHGIGVSETVRRACKMFFFQNERLEERAQSRKK